MFPISFSPVTSTDEAISPKILPTFSFDPFANTGVKYQGHT